jgi:acyl carrier protein
MTEKILEIISATMKEQLDINANIDKTSKLLDLGVDSIGFMVLIVYLENGLNVEINIELILDREYALITVGDIIDVILIILRENGDEV